jgi:surface polysaccharide O-acyltransferase-like enzyme
MALLTAAVFIIAILLRNKHQITAKIGFVSWISLSLYFIIEFIVIQATIASYDFLRQPMSDLGVTICGTNTYELAPYEICSPYHLLMNWTFTLTGIVIFTGAIFLHQNWAEGRKSRMATVLLVIYGLSYALSGIIPADVNFVWHTLTALPGMFVQIPALFLIGSAVREQMPKLAAWTRVSAILTAVMLLLLFLQPFFQELPGGLLQRLLYGFVYLWMIVAAIVLWIKGESQIGNKTIRH